MQVRDIMTREVITVEPKTGVVDIAKKLVQNDIKGVPVVDKGGQVLGLITEADLILQNATFHIPTFLQILGGFIEIDAKEREDELKKMVGVYAEDVMSSPAISVDPDMSVEDLANLMWDKKINPVPIVEDGFLVGIVSRADIIQLIANSLD